MTTPRLEIWYTPFGIAPLTAISQSDFAPALRGLWLIEA